MNCLTRVGNSGQTFSGPRQRLQSGAAPTPHRFSLQIFWSKLMTLAHAVLWLDHHHADVIQFNSDEVHSQKVKDSQHDTGQHNSGVRTQHEFFGTVCDALAGISMVLVTGSHMAQTNFKHYVEKHREHLMPHLVGWETVDHPTEGELVALAKKFFLAHDNMIGQHKMA